MSSGDSGALSAKALTGIPGFDALSNGGLPRGRATLLGGGAGSGKTVFALQTLVNGARDCDEPGIFVAFEEDSKRVIANAERFGWDLPELQSKKLFFLDAQPSYDTIHSGQLDLGGMLAALGAKVDELGARRIVFDAIDVVLALLDDEAQVRRELYRLNDWLVGRGLTAIITAKSLPGDLGSGTPRILDFMQFMVDCLVMLGHEMMGATSVRNVRIVKYRGSAFEENATPFLIGSSGIDTAFARTFAAAALPATHERVSSGIERLDAMLGGGFLRGGSILMTGGPGTAKTTLCGAFAEAACRRGEKTLFIIFESRINEMIRDLDSVAIRLCPFIDSGLLDIHSARPISGSADVHLMRIRTMAREHGARCVVIDPLSDLFNFGNKAASPGVAARLIDWAKSENITLMCTSPPDHTITNAEAVPLQISNIADTWIHLSYFERGGERNRTFSIVKSRGTDHSNQVRELILSSSGVSVTDVYTVGGEVLMGTLRWAKERTERLANEDRAATTRLGHLKLEAESAELDARLKVLQREILLLGERRKVLVAEEHERADDLVLAKTEIRHLRAGDDPQAENHGPPTNG